MSSFVFVYGTLLAGEGNHELLDGARRVGHGTTLPVFELRDLGPYPGLVEGGSQAVVGEVYEVDEVMLRALDAFEDHPRLYRRMAITLSDGQIVQTYVMSERRAAGSAIIESGNWRERHGV